VLKIWRVFDIQQPILLTETTLTRTLLGNLGQPLDIARRVHYTLGVYVRQDEPDGPYVIENDGRATPPMYTVVEKFVPGQAWIIVTEPHLGDSETNELQREITREARSVLNEVAHGT